MKTVLPARRAAPAEKTLSDIVRRKVRLARRRVGEQVSLVVNLLVNCLSISLCDAGGRKATDLVPDQISNPTPDTTALPRNVGAPTPRPGWVGLAVGQAQTKPRKHSAHHNSPNDNVA